MSKIGSAVSEEKSFENVNGRTDGRTDDGRKVITIAHPEQSSGELKNKKKQQKNIQMLSAAVVHGILRDNFQKKKIVMAFLFKSI